MPRRGPGPSTGLRAAIRDLGPTATTAAVAASGPPRTWRRRATSPARSGGRPAAVEAPRKYVVANGYGADPACGTDRYLLETDPYAVIEGAAIAAFAIGATEAIIAVRAEDAEAIRRLETAIGAAEDAGVIGPDAFGQGRDLTVTVRTVQGAYMLGEETVLLKALEGKRGQPEQRPPHPAERGLWGMPTVVHNVQTLACLGWIIRHGPEAFAATGVAGSPGTILVGVRTPSGDGIAEVPLGTTASRHRGARRGPAGRPLDQGRARRWSVGRPAAGRPRSTPRTASRRCATPGAHIGSGSVVVADDRACVVDLARLLTRFCAGEACGKTIPCRIGTRRLVEIADRVDRRPAAPDRPRAAGRPLGRHRRLRAVRPRAPDDPPAPERDAILPSGTRRARPAQFLPRRRLPPDRGGGRCDLIRRPMADLLTRPDSRPAPEPESLADRLLDTRSPQRPQSSPTHPRRGGRPRHRGVRGPDDPRGLPRQRHRDPDALLRAQAARLRRLPDVRGRGRGRGHAADLVLADVRAGDEDPDPDRGGPPPPPDQPGAHLQRPQRLLPAAVPEQVPEPHRHPGLPEGQRRGRLAREHPDLQAHDPVPVRARPGLPGPVRGALPPRRGRRGDRHPRQPPLRRRPGPQGDARRRRRPTPAVRAPGRVRSPRRGHRFRSRPAWRRPSTCSCPVTTSRSSSATRHRAGCSATGSPSTGSPRSRCSRRSTSRSPGSAARSSATRVSAPISRSTT